MALEVQSRGRSVAELQVSGVKIAFTKRPLDVSIMLTVHSLLLVDALQTFGPDFELLVASHRHVGMDSMSGSLRDSEPTSPISPGSPDPNISRAITTSPIALTQALTSLASSPPMQPWLQATTTQKVPNVLDAEALITVEVVIVLGQDPMRIANIQFNNLDIIGKYIVKCFVVVVFIVGKCKQRFVFFCCTTTAQTQIVIFTVLPSCNVLLLLLSIKLFLFVCNQTIIRRKK